MSSQKPTLGRIVHVSVTPVSNLGQDEAPALVTGVNKDGSIDVTAFLRTGHQFTAAGLGLFDTRPDDDNAPAHACWWPAVPKPPAAKTTKDDGGSTLSAS